MDPGDVFVACPGARMDGHDFLGEAVLANAAAIVYEREPEFTLPHRMAAIRVQSTPKVLSLLLNRYYGNPSAKLKMVGVTGTNGKTTIAYLLHQLLRENVNAAYLGTLWYELPSSKFPAVNTTPGPEVLLPLLKSMAEEKVGYCVMEVSSHALMQRRIHGIHFELALFTQLTQDHLDYHKNMEDYYRAKRLLFTEEPRPKHMLINRDCSFGERLLTEIPQAKSLSLESPADYQAIEIEPSFQGSRFKFRFKNREIPIQIRLPLRHNVFNVAAVLSGLEILGFDPEDFRGALAEITGIPGRLERVTGKENQNFQVFVDYAHTPDAIENVLREARRLNPSRILTLFGCGGDRDRSKRPLMAQAAFRWSDIVVLTSDNPRSEDPEAILGDIKKGISPEVRSKVEIYEILNREEAIIKLINLAEPGDVLFVLGKGHEDYQILGERKIPFDDRLVVRECLNRKSRVFLS